MPRKTPEPRKAGPTSAPKSKDRRTRPDPLGRARKPYARAGMRDRRFDRRPPKFPGRLGGR